MPSDEPKRPSWYDKIEWDGNDFACPSPWVKTSGVELMLDGYFTADDLKWLAWVARFEEAPRDA
jgi:hypothetical protein